jgi:hypothetical protein
VKPHTSHLAALIHQRAHEPDGSPRDALYLALDELNDEELAPVAFLIRRVLKGRQLYGPLDLASDGRDMQRERLEEIADDVCYSIWSDMRRRSVAAE